MMNHAKEMNDEKGMNPYLKFGIMMGDFVRPHVRHYVSKCRRI